VPRLIIEHNIHGIDIDPRAVQIANLSLWLRAQRAWQEMGIPAAPRPQITRSNVVTAEPMPGDRALLDEFVATLDPPVLGYLVRVVFDKMQLAGEAGSLLKIEEELSEAIARARAQWEASRAVRQAALLPDVMREPPRQGELFDVSNIADAEFWERAEELVLAELARYAGQHDLRHRLFAGDAARGFAFIDVCRKRYDVVLMNPPFGEVSLIAREYLYGIVPESSRDIFAAFVRVYVLHLSPSGKLGAITNRLAFFNEFLGSWRKTLFMGEVSSLELTADLGYGVLDALVETAAFVCSKSSAGRALFLNIHKEADKQTSIEYILDEMRASKTTQGIYERNVTSFGALPGNRFAYTISPKWLRKLNVKNSHDLFLGKGGICTGDDFRFYRCYWEIPWNDAQSSSWRWLAKGGEFSRYRTNTHLVIDWNNESFLLRTKNSDLYGRPGATYTYRTTSNLSARVLNKGVCFSQGGPGIIARDLESASFVLAYMNSFAATYCLENMIGGGDFSVKGSAARNLEPRYLEHLPIVALTANDSTWFHDQVCGLLTILDRADDDEAHPLHLAPWPLTEPTLLKCKVTENRIVFENLAKAYEIVCSLEQRIGALLDLDPDDVSVAYSESGWPFPGGQDMDSVPFQSLVQLDGVPRDTSRITSAQDEVNYRFQNKLSHYLHVDVEYLAHKHQVSPMRVCIAASRVDRCTIEGLQRFVVNVLSYCMGDVFGRWDIRYATGERPAPALPDPFAPLPACPPGMLQNSQGLPAAPEDVPTDYPLRIAWDGILVDDPGLGDPPEPHDADIVRRVREALAVLWPETHDSIEAEACEILGVRELRDYFRRPGGFFADHLKRYSKSRRQAPIYWPLATASGRYTVWLYYHRLTGETLYTVVNRYVEPKLGEVERALAAAEAGMGQASGREATRLREQADELRTFRAELDAFRTELLRVAGLPYRPNLDDGVIINAAPLHRLFGLRKWAKDTEAVWRKLEAGEYDWAHLAYTLWPARVREVCRRDRSIAIAHGLEELCEAPVKAPGKAKKGKESEEVEADDLDFEEEPSANATTPSY
jgi:hypothetical protein